MKRHLTLACVALALMATSTAAQTRAHLSFGGGITQPSGDFGDVAKLGWHGLASIGVFPGWEPFGFQGVAFYGENKFEVGGGKAKLFGALAELRFNLRTGAPFTPYLTAGGGLVNVKATGGGGSSSETNGALEGGIGVSYLGAGNVGVFVEARYVNVFDSGPDLTFVPLTAGLRIAIR